MVRSPNWDNGTIANAGAVTWGNGIRALQARFPRRNSLVGSKADDGIGANGVTALSNGNYIVRSSIWDHGSIIDAGAVTWGNGNTGITGVVSQTNSLVGSKSDDQVGRGGVTALNNGNFVVSSPLWDNGTILNAGAVTWGNGTTGITGVVSPTNSLVGSTYFDQVGWVGSPL